MDNFLASLRERYRGASALAHELLGLIVCLLLGVVVMPCLIWMMGRFALGPYTHGGVFALWSDFLRGLAQGSMAFWTIALGPYLFFLIFRAGRRLLS